MAGVSEVFNLDFKFGGNSEFLARLESLMERIDARFESTTDDISEAADATKEMSDAVDELNGSFKSGLSSMSAFGEKLKDIVGYYISFQAAKEGVERIWSFGRDSMEAYSTQERAENQLKGVLKNRGALDQFDSIKAFAGDIQGRSIYGDEAMIKGAGELATYVKGVDSLKSMMTLLTDYAAGMTGGGEVSPDQMESLATGLGMAYDGNYMAMRRKGFDTSKLEALDAIVENGGTWGAKDIKKYGDVLDKDLLAQIKQNGGVTEQMRVDALKESLKDWQGLSDTVNNLDSSALIRFNNKLGDLREEVGKKIYPTFNKLVASIDAHMPDIEKMFDAIGECFERLAETLDANLDRLIDFGKWLADAIPDIVEFGSSITKAIGKVVSLTDAFKYLITYMVVEKVYEFGKAIHDLVSGGEDGKGGLAGAISKMRDSISGEKGLIGSLDEFSKTAAGTQVAIIGITWALKQFAEFANAYKEYLKTKEDVKKTNEHTVYSNESSLQLNKAALAIKNGDTSDAAKMRLHRAMEVYARYNGGDEAARKRLRELFGVVDKAQQGEKMASKFEVHNNYTNIEQNVNLAADIQKVGILLNQNVRAIIEKQLVQNREVSLARGV